MYDVIIIGNGPAGLTAGIYAKRAGYSCLIIDASPIGGGAILNTYEVDNYPGVPGVTGMELGEKFKAHADKLGVEFATATVKSIETDGAVKKVNTRKETFECKSIIISTGASNRKLGVPGEDDFLGAGVSYCATCDGAFYKEATVAVVGGGDVALEDALYLARGCEKVYLIHRRDEFRGAKILQDEVKATANIECIMDTVVDSIEGADSVEKLLLSNKKTGEQVQVEVSGVFIAVGVEPNTNKIVGMPELDAAGYIIANEDCVTSIPGVFAAGDVRTKGLRQVITACADGANAVTSIEKYIREIK